MKIFNKKCDVNEIVIGSILFVLIIMTMNKSLPHDIEEILVSFQGMFVFLVLLMVFFLKFHSLIGILLLIFIYMVFENNRSTIPNHKVVNLNNNKIVRNPVEKKFNYNSLEEEVVQTMLPISRNGGLSQPKYTASSSSNELYTTM
jgi:Ca2+/Na+ antiporter